jgi:adenylate kinase
VTRRPKILNINLFGPFGAGKGTQAELLAKKFKLAHFVAGDLLKDEMRRRTAFGREVDAIVRKGKLVPDRYIRELLVRFLDSLPKTKGMVIDGSPRNLPQKKLMDALLATYERTPIPILIDISEKESFRRLGLRRICVACAHKPIGKDLNKKDCQRCGGRLVIRFDDRPDIIKKRMSVYKKEVLPVIRSYKRSGRMYTVNGEQERADVHKDILKLLSRLGYKP